MWFGEYHHARTFCGFDATKAGDIPAPDILDIRMRRLVGRRQDFSREREDRFQRPALGGGDHDGPFKPDRSKGNQTPFEPVGVVDEQGIYTVTTKGKDGAPPGWYKVLVSAVPLGSAGA